MVSKLIFILFISLCSWVGTQLTLTVQTDKKYCIDQQRVVVPEFDSTRRQLVLDSVNRLLIGRWQLIEIGRSSLTMPTPEQSIEISVDAQGHAIVYRQGVPKIDFILFASSTITFLRCGINETGRTYFRLLKNSRGGDIPNVRIYYPNGLRVCEEFLEIWAPTSAGPYYIFKRLTPIYSGNK